MLHYNVISTKSSSPFALVAPALSTLTLVEQAVEMAVRHGYHVFPLAGKRPIFSEERTGSRWGCSNDPQTIRRRFHEAGRSATGVGIATEESGLFVIDIDTKAGGHADDGFAPFFDLEKQYGQVSQTITARSPSGSIHLYFNHVRGLKMSASEVAPGVDVRAIGSFVVAPPTLTAKGHYEWIHSPADIEVADAPLWLIFKAMFHKFKERRILAARGIHDHTGLAEIAVDDWRQYVDALVAEHEAEQRQVSARRRVSVSVGDCSSDPLNRSQAAIMEVLPWRLLDGIVGGVKSLPPGDGHRKNESLHKASVRAGHVVGHPDFASSGMTAAMAESRLLAASSGWGERHTESVRLDSIRRGVAHGVSEALSSRWLTGRIDRALNPAQPLDDDTTPAANDIERVSTEEARMLLREQVSEAFEQIAAFRRGEIEKPPFAAIGKQITADTGLGKTEAVIDAIKANLADADRGGGILYFAKTLKLADEIRERLIAAGIHEHHIRVHRGRGADDPTSVDGGKMCNRHELAEVSARSEQTIERTLCNPRRGAADEKTLQCPFFETCAYRRQHAEGKAAITITSHATLALDGVDGLPDSPYAIVIDEDFTAITPARRKDRDQGRYLTAAQLERRVTIEVDVKKGADADAIKVAEAKAEVDTNDIRYWRRLVVKATNNAAGDYLRLDHLLDAGFNRLDTGDKFAPNWLESKLRKQDEPQSPASEDVAQYEAKLDRHAPKPRLWRQLWREVYDMLSGDGEVTTQVYCAASGDVLFADHGIIADRYGGLAGRQRAPALRPKSSDSSSSTSRPHVPIIMLDATPPPEADHTRVMGLAAPQAGQAVSAAAPHMLVELVLSAPTSKTKLTPADKAKSISRNAKRVGLSIRADMAQHGHDANDVLVVTHMSTKEGLTRWLPGVEIRHYGALAGLDGYGQHRALYLVGAPLPALDAVVAAEEAARYEEIPTGELEWTPQVVKTRTGERYEVTVASHADAGVAARLAHIRDSAMIQALGRLRGVNRTTDNPCRAVILADVALKCEVDSVQDWTQFESDAIGVMAAAGFVPQGRDGAWGAWSSLFESEKECKTTMDYCSWSPPADDGWREVEFRASGGQGAWFKAWTRLSDEEICERWNVEIKADPVVAMVASGMVFTSPALAFAASALTPEHRPSFLTNNLIKGKRARLPVSWPSVDSCRKSLRANPPECPPGWQTFTIRLARSSKDMPVYAAPHLTAEDIIARADAMGFTIKQIDRA